MKKVASLVLVVLAVLVIGAVFARADQITFSFIGNTSIQNLSAGLGGFAAGPSLNVLVTDATTGVRIDLPGVFTTSTGIANSFTVLTSPNLVLASYSAGGADSVLITSLDGKTVYVAGVNENRGEFVSAYPSGTGAFLNSFTVTQVDPAVLGMFGLGPGFDSRGSVSITSGTGNLVGRDALAATIGGGTVTIESTAIPEPAGLGLAGMGLLAAAGMVRRRRGKGAKDCQSVVGDTAGS